MMKEKTNVSLVINYLHSSLYQTPCVLFRFAQIDKTCQEFFIYSYSLRQCS